MKNLFEIFKGLLTSYRKKEWAIGQVTLLVSNIHSMKRFYTEILGLAILQDFETEVLLGIAQGSVPLLRLISVKNSVKKSMTTTYYLGFQLPKRHMLGDLSNHLLLEEQTIMATTDDGYSEAFYIMDPEQNRLKFYWEKKELLLEDVNHQEQYLEGTRLGLPVEHFLQLGDIGGHTLPAKTRINQVHYTVESVEETVDYLQKVFGFKTTYDYVDGRKNFQINDHYFSLAVNEWEHLDTTQTLLGIREIMFLVPHIRVLEEMVTRLEKLNIDFLYQDAELKVVTPDSIRFHFKVGETI